MGHSPRTLAFKASQDRVYRESQLDERSLSLSLRKQTPRADWRQKKKEKRAEKERVTSREREKRAEKENEKERERERGGEGRGGKGEGEGEGRERRKRGSTTCGRFAGTHGSVLNLHTGRFSACQAAPHTDNTHHTAHTHTTQHTTQHTHHTQQYTTTPKHKTHIPHTLSAHIPQHTTPHMHIHNTQQHTTHNKNTQHTTHNTRNTHNTPHTHKLLTDDEVFERISIRHLGGRAGQEMSTIQNGVRYRWNTPLGKVEEDWKGQEDAKTKNKEEE